MDVTEFRQDVKISCMPCHAGLMIDLHLVGCGSESDEPVSTRLLIFALKRKLSYEMQRCCDFRVPAWMERDLLLVIYMLLQVKV